MKFFIGFIFLLYGFTANAQCEKCPPTDEKANYCYTDTRFEGLCAKFVSDKQYFYFAKKKKAKRIDINFDKVDDLLTYKGLTLDKKLKLTANDLLFIQLAIETWNVEKKKIGYDFLSSGLGIKVLKEGTGETPQKGQEVVVHYSGFLENGEKFDSSRDRNSPFTFRVGVGQVIKGWDEGVLNLPVGSRAMLMIPSELGYGSRNVGPIPANSTLYFDIEVLDAK
ncbi:FKBP-type peptidyl-prolyl cis-trans isomerase [Flammeovirga sp. SubArs3]|uniref:FKBP-type peptidyl-prolyl cis-trans isomerase n=1 Tax=Flammeovirga sp. SubArs3 TaxID=2995316 RepID=UPI00248AEFBC|nr:FKBP-type peptidyl-prolyl cis-trans isomerase [Flammeovirga sp. SubArs3]